jgi:hypothetical protein
MEIMGGFFCRVGDLGFFSQNPYKIEDFFKRRAGLPNPHVYALAACPKAN